MTQNELADADREAVRQREMALLAQEVQAATAPVADHITALGGDVVYNCTYAPCLSARLTAPQVLELAQRGDVQRMGLLVPSTPDHMDGSEKATVYQTSLFRKETFTEGGTTYRFDGDNGQTTDIRVAVLDDEGFLDSHRAFREGTSGDRIDRMWDCTSPPCRRVNHLTPVGNHGTAVLGTLMADYHDGQASLDPRAWIRPGTTTTTSCASEMARW